MKWSECTVYPLYQIYFWLAEVMVEESVGLVGGGWGTRLDRVQATGNLIANYCPLQHL